MVVPEIQALIEQIINLLNQISNQDKLTYLIYPKLFRIDILTNSTGESLVEFIYRKK